MSTGPEFIPDTKPGHVGEAFSRGVKDAQSWMNQAQERKMREQEMEQKRVEFEIRRPVEVAKQQADLTTAAASLALAKRMQEFRTQAAAVATAANEEYLEASQLADWEAQSSELQRIQAKYSWMNVLPEYKPFLDQVDKTRTNAMTRAAVDLKFGRDKEIEEIKQRGTTDRNINTTKTWEKKMLDDIREAEDSGDDELAQDLIGVYNKKKQRPDSEILDKPETTEIDGKKFYRSRKGGEWKPLSTESMADRVSTDVMTALGVPNFKTEEDAAAARQKGEIKNGQTIIVGGKRAKWED